MHEEPCTTEQTGAEEESEEDLDVEEGEEEADDAWFRDAEEEGYGDKDVEAEEVCMPVLLCVRDRGCGLYKRTCAHASLLVHEA